MQMKPFALAGALVMAATAASADCPADGHPPISMLSSSFEAWQVVTGRMTACGDFTAELNQEFRTIQPTAFAANPSIYQIGGVSNGTLVPLINDGTVRPLDDLVERFGQQLTPNQLIRIDGQIMAVAMMVNAQHLMVRQDIFDDLGLEIPTTYDALLAAAATIRDAGVVDYPFGSTFANGWDLAQEFVNLYLGNGGAFFADGNMPAVNNETGVATLETLRALTEFMDPEFLVANSTYVQQQMQQGRVAMVHLWASRAAAMDNEAESQVAGRVTMAASPMGAVRPATTLWWDGMVIARNATDAEAEAAFQLMMHGIAPEAATENPDSAIWIIDGYQPGPAAAGAAASAANGAVPYPASAAMGLMHTALGNNIAGFLTGQADAAATLAAIEEAYLTAARENGLVQ